MVQFCQLIGIYAGCCISYQCAALSQSGNGKVLGCQDARNVEQENTRIRSERYVASLLSDCFGFLPDSFTETESGERVWRKKVEIEKFTIETRIFN